MANALLEITKRYFFCWVLLSVVFIVAIPVRSFATQDLRYEHAEVHQFLRSFFYAAREYDLLRMSELVSRQALENNIGTIIRSSNDMSLKRSAMLLFNAEFTFALSCRIHIVDVVETDSELLVRVWLEKSIEPGQGPSYDFFLSEEAGGLRLNRFNFDKQEQVDSEMPDISLCDVPVNWDNPAIIKPDETLKEQQERLGIP